MARSSRLLLIALLLSSASPSRVRADGLYLYVIPASVARGARIEPGTPLRVAAYVARPEALARSLAANVLAVADDHVELDLGDYPQLEPTQPDVDAYRASSFVIDFEEPAVRALRATLVARYGPSPSVEELRRFTAEAIPDKSSERGWDLASQVAASGVGDCTEHAVLLAALARAVGRPARVAMGVLVATQAEAPYAFGHAWAEIHDGIRWRPVDATPVAEQAGSLGYLPVTLLTDEGPGYAMPILRSAQQTWVRRVEIR